jgi:hypothetical protein
MVKPWQKITNFFPSILDRLIPFKKPQYVLTTHSFTYELEADEKILIRSDMAYQVEFYNKSSETVKIKSFGDYMTLEPAGAVPDGLRQQSQIILYGTPFIRRQEDYEIWAYEKACTIEVRKHLLVLNPNLDNKE